MGNKNLSSFEVEEFLFFNWVANWINYNDISFSDFVANSNTFYDWGISYSLCEFIGWNGSMIFSWMNSFRSSLYNEHFSSFSI
jgi:hypothetical protein